MAKKRQTNTTEEAKLAIHTMEIELIPGGLLLQLVGQINMSNTLQFQSQVREAMGFDFNHLFFDCSKLSFISSSGIGAFTSIKDLVTSNDGEIIICGLDPEVFHVFDLLGFSEYFAYSDSIDEAISQHHETMNRLTGVFPLIFRCPGCAQRQKAMKEGRFQCADCKSILTVDESGDVTPG